MMRPTIIMATMVPAFVLGALLLAGAFLRLDRSPDGHSVVVATPRGEVAVSDPDAERAYALALLTLLDA